MGRGRHFMQRGDDQGSQSPVAQIQSPHSRIPRYTPKSMWLKIGLPTRKWVATVPSKYPVSKDRAKRGGPRNGIEQRAGQPQDAQAAHEARGGGIAELGRPFKSPSRVAPTRRHRRIA
jgi:hypothetical protein